MLTIVPLLKDKSSDPHLFHQIQEDVLHPALLELLAIHIGRIQDLSIGVGQKTDQSKEVLVI